MIKYENEFINACKYIIEQGVDIQNERTGSICRTVPFLHFSYNVGAGEVPILTIKQVFWKSAIAEIIGYLNGITDAHKFDELGAKTWYANANKTKAWLTNPNRKGENDMGKVYGAVAKDFNGVDLIKKVYTNLKKGVDDRGEIITFWNPADFDKGCLRPCLIQHHFTLIGDTLHLTSYQRSCDMGLGFNFNSIQVYFLLAFMAKATGHKAGIANHIIVNAHFYENQFEPLMEMLGREPLDVPHPTLEFTIPKFVEFPWENFNPKKDVTLTNYEHLGKIEFPFTE